MATETESETLHLRVKPSLKKAIEDRRRKLEERTGVQQQFMAVLRSLIEEGLKAPL